MADIEYIHYDPKLVPAPVAQNNTGAICWFNSLMQTLLGIPAIAQILLDYAPEFKNNGLAREYTNILANGQTSNSSYGLLRAFLARMKTMKINLNIGAQGQDCAGMAMFEFIRGLGPRIEEAFKTVVEFTITCPNCGAQTQTTRDDACHLGVSGNVIFTTEAEFKKYLHLHEDNVDAWKCDECRVLSRDVKRRAQLKVLRSVIMVLFEHNHTLRRRWFPSSMTFPKIGGGNLTYNLVGKINYSGCITSGHYYAHSLRDSWYCLNDTSMSSGSSAPEPNTVLAIYHLV